MNAVEQLVFNNIKASMPDAGDELVLKAMADWEILPYHQDGELVGAALMKGTEFHCLTLPAFRLRREPMREFLRPLFERHGMLTTRVAKTDLANQRFNKAFGFQRTWSDDQYHYYILAALPFERKATCQQ